MRLAIGGIHIESSTFSPLPSTLPDFTAKRGREMMDRYPFLGGPEFSKIEAVPLAHFRALPGGVVMRDAYEAMKAEILARLASAGLVDAFYLDIHGAMAVEGLDDAEADLAEAIRARLPADAPITCSQDLHGNVSARLVASVDLITAYRTAPHVDWMETRERAVRLLLRMKNSAIRPVRAWVGIPVLVSGEMSSTEWEPGLSLYAPLEEESKLPGIWDASLWVGYAWADQTRSMASVVVSGESEQAVRDLACRIAARYWNARHAFAFSPPSGSLEWCFQEAVSLGCKAVFLSDAGDNPTAGGAGDVTDSLQRLLRLPAVRSGQIRVIYASIPDPEAVACCVASGINGRIEVRVGGKLDPIHSTPALVDGIVAAIDDGDPVGGTQAVVRCGGLSLILTSRRKPFHKRDDFLRLGLDPLDHEVTVVKIGYLEPELKAMARHHYLVLSPGGVNPDLTALEYRTRPSPCYPWNHDFPWEPRPVLSH